MRFWISVSLLAVLGAAPAAGLTPHLVKDINPVASSQGSAPQDYVVVGDLAFFTATDSVTGRELWRTDGTEAGTFQVVDACPGSCIGGPRFVAQNGKSYFFIAASGDSEEELWVSGGTPANTFRLTDGLGFPSIREGIWSAWIASQGLLYFTADDGVHGRELWRTDGTLAGTHLAVDMRPGPASSNPGELTDFNGRLHFRADDGQRGPSLWQSDGTVAGTQLVRDPVLSSAFHSGPVFLNVVGRTLYFVAPVRGRGAQLWKSDGTAKGTVPLSQFRSSPSSPTFLDFTRLGNRLLFVAFEPTRGQELWASDGTAKGTLRLTDLPRAESFFRSNEIPRIPLPRVPAGNRMVFHVDDGPHGGELWTTDGTPKGTRLIRDLCPGTCSGATLEPAVLGGRAFFSGRAGEGDFDPWVTDGTAAGTRRIRDLCPVDCLSTPSDWQAAAGRIFFIFPQTVGVQVRHVRQLWTTDGTSQGTVQLSVTASADLDQGRSRGVSLRGKFLFSAADEIYGGEPWLSDGTPQGTGVVADINVTDLGGSNPRDWQILGSKAYFLAYDGEHGEGALWSSDGTGAGTAFVADLFPDEDPFSPSNPPSLGSGVVVGDRLFLVVQVPNGESSLWRTDGTPIGTVSLLPEGARLTPFLGLAALGNEVYFAASDGIHGDELWVTDGTVAGTRMAVDLAVGADSESAPRDLTAFQGNLYFSAAAGEEAGRELWRSDGTPAGTVLLADIDPRPHFGSEPRSFTEHAGRLHFVAQGDLGARIWSTDGAVAGTAPLDLFPPSASFGVGPLVSAGSRLFFFGGSNELGRGLWVTDGTREGTDLLANVFFFGVHPLTRPIVFNGRVYFPGARDTFIGALWTSDGTSAGTGLLRDRDGREIRNPFSFQTFAGQLFFTTERQGWLYQSDGTQAGTFKLQELRSPAEFSSLGLAAVGPRLLFRSWDSENGSELWGLEVE